MSQDKLMSPSFKIQQDQIKVDFITKLDKAEWHYLLTGKFSNDTMMHSLTLQEVPLNSHFLSSAYGLEVNQRKVIRKEKQKKQRKDKYPQSQLIIGVVLDNRASCD